MLRRILLLALVALTGCASYDGRGLVPGRSTEAQVEALMGPAVYRRAGPGGDKYVYYSRLPFGREMYVATIDSSGTLKALEQRLQERYFAKVQPGVTRADDIRALFGPPHRIDKFARMGREIWEYPWRGLTSDRLLLVQYSYDGIVREFYSIEDPQGVGSDGDGA